MKSVVDPVVWRDLRPGQRCRIRIADLDAGTQDVLWESADRLVEAANWTPDGASLIVNSHGRLFRLDVDRPSVLELIPTGGLDDLNNDHLVSRDGSTIYASSEGTGHIFAMPVRGGTPHRITPDRDGTFSYFLQGLSPDGDVLSYAGATPVDGDQFRSSLHTIRTDGTDDRVHTSWPGSTVGFEYSPDGAWWYFNSDAWGKTTGGAQIYRMRPDGSQREQLTTGPRVHWFPKVSPTGDRVVYLSFPAGTIGHDANVEVELWLMAPDGRHQEKLLDLVGGQGTLNVTSWEPGGRRFAFIDYPS